MTRVAILWHMHQPLYQDLATGEHILPWVRLHGLKDYWGMVSLLREFPSLKVTFNLVPSLLVQLQAFARNEARDQHLEIGLKPADTLTEDERAFCVEHFFHAHRPRMVDPYPRYRELLERRGGTNGGLSARTRATQFSVDDLRDLQVWHKLAWIDVEYQERDARVRALLAKGKGYGEDDKWTLRQVELELLRRVIPEHAEAAARGQVELSTSPFYHPILPLLCDTDIHLHTHPHSRMPRAPFRHPEDAREQLTRARDFHASLFGAPPRGIWPSEGSVSDAMVPLVAQAGLVWMATDEEILARSLGRTISRNADGQVDQPTLLYRPYRVGEGADTVACGFRDHALSDLIGFSYGSWSADGAATDFVHRLVEAGRRYSAATGGEEATVFVILDGENAWEHYERQGRPFLRALYGRLVSHPELRTVTMSEACAPATALLPSIFPGSWIHSDFYIWIGHPDDHRAWSQLVDARQALDMASGTVPESAQARAREEMLIAEGSDWFWWCMATTIRRNTTSKFDDLFRRHVRNVYRALDQPIPEELFVSNISTQPPVVAIDAPTGFITPTIDGELTDYFEWIGAGSVEAVETAGAMHKVAQSALTLRRVEFGFNLTHLFLRIDGAAPMQELAGQGLEIRVRFVRPPGLQVRITLELGEPQVSLERRAAEGGPWVSRTADGLAVAVGSVLELQIPFASLEVTASTPVALLVAVNRGREELEHHPRHRSIEFDVPGPAFPARAWTV